MSLIDSQVQLVEEKTTLCAYCPKMCRFSCPVSEAESRETLTPHAKMSLLHLSKRRSGDSIAPKQELEEVLSACTSCGACTAYCAHGNPVGDVLGAGRHQLATVRSLRIRNSFAASGDIKGRVAVVDSAIPSSRKADIAYFPGCSRIFQSPERIIGDLAVLSTSFGQEIKMCVLEAGKHCCGYPLVAEGAIDEWKVHLATLAQALSGYKEVITPDPGCAYVLNDLAKKHDVDVELPIATTLVEFCARGVPHEPEKSSSRWRHKRVFYHDACYLGRKRGVIDAPRALLEQALGRPVEELTQCGKEDSICSGSGGLYPMSSSEGAKRVAQRILDFIPDDVRRSDLLVVTACPSARKGFERAGINACEVTDILQGDSP